MDVTAATAEAKERGFHYLDDARVLIALNNAKNAFEDEFDWPWLETTQTGPSPLSVSDVKHVLYVYNATTSVSLVGIDSRDRLDLFPGSVSGAPGYWWLDGDQVVSFPSDASTITARYVRFSPELSAPTDTPLIPARYHPLWIDLAVIELAKDDEDFQDVQTLVQDTQRRLQRLVEIYAVRNYQNSAYQVITYASEDW